MARTKSEPKVINLPLLKTVEQMAKLSGIGENKLRQLIETGQIEYVLNGNRRMLTEASIIDWYNRTKIPVSTAVMEE